MPHIFDNVEQQLLPSLRASMERAYRGDFCVGYFNLRGWQKIENIVEKWEGGPEAQARVLIGMNRRPDEELKAALIQREETISKQQLAILARNEIIDHFKQQLTWGAPSNDSEAGLRKLAEQIRSQKVHIKLFTEYSLHAKLYLFCDNDAMYPRRTYLGSSNLTVSGLLKQGELNIDVPDQDAAAKLATWFEDKWNNKYCIDITAEVLELIETSWITPELPYHIYLKIAYHLSNEARAGMSEYEVPAEFRGKLFTFQEDAVKVAARYLYRRGGVFIGDVVGLGKTYVAIALAKLMEETYGYETLILCPKNLKEMWKGYRNKHLGKARVISISSIEGGGKKSLESLERYRTVIIDESHNLRNPKGKKYQEIKRYLLRAQSKVILLSATPFNKTYGDLAAQLKLFLPEDQDLPVRPEKYIKELGGEQAFKAKTHIASPNCLKAFQKSEHPEDWQELMRLFLIRRTRGLIQRHHATADEELGLYFLTLSDGTKSYFPKRTPKSVKFAVDDADPNDQFARLYQKRIVDKINDLEVPRYGLGNYAEKSPKKSPTPAEKQMLENLGKAGKRLMGFCRTNLFKRLESSGFAFLLSVERHLLRNYLFLYAIENEFEFPIGTLDQELVNGDDRDPDDYLGTEVDEKTSAGVNQLRDPAEFQKRAKEIYHAYASLRKNRFKWVRSNLFSAKLREHLAADSKLLHEILDIGGTWDPAKDHKLNELEALILKKHPSEKILIFSQFSDTSHYLVRELKSRGATNIAAVSGHVRNPTDYAKRFSPKSNEAIISTEDELRVLIATDILSEGQNLQDAHIVLNFDIPWAIIRLVQRAGRVDRIGQTAKEILCYSFWPSDGVEKLIALRQVVTSRLKQNEEVLGADEAFFEEDKEKSTFNELYTGKNGSLDDKAGLDTDLPSRAYEIWREAIAGKPELEQRILGMARMVNASRRLLPDDKAREKGAIVFARTAHHERLVYLNEQAGVVTQSAADILEMLRCDPETKGEARAENHHSLEAKALEIVSTEDQNLGGAFGRTSESRSKAYERVKAFRHKSKGTLFGDNGLEIIQDALYKWELVDHAKEDLRLCFRRNISDDDLMSRLRDMYEKSELTVRPTITQDSETLIVCSMGLQ
jgi:superfamily II DNA or RNA helicase